MARNMGTGHGRTALVADDEPDIRGAVKVRLEREGYTVLAAADGDEALALAIAHRPDVAILDGTMPGRSGFDVLDEIRRTPSLADTLVIMLTARAARTDIEMGFERGADEYITKPFSPRELVVRIDQLLGEEPTT